MKIIVAAALLMSVPAMAQDVHVLGPITGYACMNLNLSDSQMRDPTAPRVQIVEAPRPDAPAGTLATATVIVRAPLHLVNGFAEVLQLNGRPGWILARMLKPYASVSRPASRCTPSMLSNQRIGFDFS